MLRILIIVLLLGSQVHAGPWPREKGKVFLSVSAQSEKSPQTGLMNNFSAAYGEYGLTEKLTLGIDLGTDGLTSSKAVAFARFPVLEREGPWLFAVEMGLGVVDTRMAVRPGFTLGRGLSLGQMGGWFTVDTRAVLKGGPRGSFLETDVTLGLNSSERTKTILQLQTGLPSKGSAYAKFAPSLVIVQKKPGHYLEIGASAGLMNAADYGVKVGVWREF